MDNVEIIPENVRARLLKRLELTVRRRWSRRLWLTPLMD